jgi:hypothetical protein
MDAGGRATQGAVAEGSKTPMSQQATQTMPWSAGPSGHTFCPKGKEYGHNFDKNAGWGKAFIDRVHTRYEQGILSSELKPTQMAAVMCKSQVESQLLHPKLTPEFCIRDPGR